MANLQTAKQAAQQRGLQPPPDYPGGPDAWFMDWFEAGVNAGDPALVKMAGGTTEEEVDPEAGEGGIAPWQNAAPASEWLGKRAPTPRELRRYARDQGWSEDFARYPDRVLANWLKKGGWDINAGTFQGGVQKPTETGGLMAPRGGGGGGGWGGGGGGGQGGAAGTAYEPPLWSPLQDMLMNQGGFLRQYDPKIGDEQAGVRGGVMGGGGIWYQPTQQPAPTPAPATPTPSAVLPGPVRPGIVGAPMQPRPTQPVTRTTLPMAPRPDFISRNPAQPPEIATLPTGPMPRPASPLVNIMAPLQGGGLGTPAPLTNMLSPYQAKQRRPGMAGSWF